MNTIQLNRKWESRFLLTLLIVLLLNFLVQLVVHGNNTMDIHIHDTYLVLPGLSGAVFTILFSLLLFFTSFGFYCFAQLGKWQTIFSGLLLLLLFVVLILLSYYVFHIPRFIYFDPEQKGTAGDLMNQLIQNEWEQKLMFQLPFSIISIFILVIRCIQLIRFAFK